MNYNNYNKLTPQQHRHILELYEHGYLYNAVGELLGALQDGQITVDYIFRVLTELGYSREEITITAMQHHRRHEQEELR